MTHYQDLLDIALSATQGDWSIPHLSKDEVECNCPYVLSENHFGSIASISVDNGKRVSDGGNDCPPLEEAKANGVFIATFNPTKVIGILKNIATLEKSRISLIEQRDYWHSLFIQGRDGTLTKEYKD